MSTILRFGIIGTGNFGKNYARLLQDLNGAELRAVANRSQQSFQNLPVIRAFPFRRYTEAEELISDPEVDCVVIATPVSSHFDLCKKALLLGKHVLVEKPMTRTLKEAKELAKVVQESGCTFMVGHQYLYNDYVRHLKEKCDFGFLGKVKYVFAEHLYLGPIRHDVGCFWETATHELAIIDYLFQPGKILQIKSMMVDFLGNGCDDFASVALKFENGIKAVIVVSWFAPEKVRRMTLGGDEGMAVFDDRASKGKLKFFQCPYPVVSSLKPTFFNFSNIPVVEPELYAREPLRNQVEHFIECVNNNTVPLTDIAHGMRITEFLYAIQNTI